MRVIYVDCDNRLKRILLCESGEPEELIYIDEGHSAEVGEVYIGRVDKVLDSGLAFVNIGLEHAAFIQPSDKKEERADLRVGKAVKVQVLKEAFDDKRAVLTTRIELNSRHRLGVIISGESSAGVSKKITDTKQRERLKRIAVKYADMGYGIILRTEAQDFDDEYLTAEMDELVGTMRELERAESFVKPPFKADIGRDAIYEAVSELVGKADTEVVVNDSEVLDRLKSKNIQGASYRLYDERLPLFARYGLDSKLNKLLQHRINLKSGGCIVIDEAEAMCVIDVNSGKAIGKNAAKKVNAEAAKEIARQLRLRNISGMIIIDFIGIGDMEYAVSELRAATKSDRAGVTLVGMTELGLMQLTRQKQRKPLRSYIMAKCPMCDGTGSIKNAEYIAGNIRAEVEAIFADTIYDIVRVSADARVLSKLRASVEELKAKYNKQLELNKITVARFDHYEITKSVGK
jgi:ribonuclease G